ncbi:acetyltransferase [Lachnospiraceae bacterium MD335]|nr:acetyltransferase [Lachnospiraceae bacterium MD335]
MEKNMLNFAGKEYEKSDRKIKTLGELRNVESECRILIFGCGGHARSVVNVINEVCGLKNVMLVDENAKKEEIILGCRTECKYDLREKDAFIVAIGDNGKRKRVYQELRKKNKGYCITVISSHANIGMEVEVGRGTFIAQNVYVGPQAEVGENTIINTGSVIEHETVIGNHTHIAPNTTVCGRVRIGNNVFCGAASTVIDNVRICDNVVIGAGAVVTDDIVESGIYIGVPAKRIR